MPVEYGGKKGQTEIQTEAGLLREFVQEIMVTRQEGLQSLHGFSVSMDTCLTVTHTRSSPRTLLTP